MTSSKEIGSFRIQGSFKLTNRGTVIYGEIVDGEVANRDTLAFLSNGLSTRLKIISVESIITSSGLAKVGLIVNTTNCELEIIENELAYITRQ